ncbi:MAG: serine protease [Caldisericia bacterium]|nr:serine protease [Caldisericia bacterium]
MIRLAEVMAMARSYREKITRDLRRTATIYGLAIIALAGAVIVSDKPVVQNITTTRPESPIASMLSAVYRVRVIGLDGSAWSGSAFAVIEDGMLVTAGHVVHDAASVVVEAMDGTIYQAEAWFESPSYDVGLIRIAPLSPLSCVFLGGGIPSPGDTVFIVGAPLGEYGWTITKGILSHPSRSIPDLSEGTVFQTDCPAYPGNSGGPVYDEYGIVVGVLVAGYDSSMNFAVPVRYVWETLRAWSE